MAELVWTEETPTAQGWYWVRMPEYTEGVVLVDEEILAAAARSSKPVLWAGPLPYPKEAK